MGGMAAQLGDHVARHRAFLKRHRSALGHVAQHSGKRRVAQQRARRLRAAVGLEKIGARFGIVAHRRGRLVAQQCGQARADREALFGQLDGRLEQRLPRQLAVLGVGQFQRAQHARRAHRAPTDDALHEVHGLAVLHEQVGRGGGGRGLAAVVGQRLVAIEMQQEQATADARRLRLDEVQHHLHRDRRIDRAAAGLQHLEAGVGGQRVGGGDHEFLRRPTGLLGEAAGGFGCPLRPRRGHVVKLRRWRWRWRWRCAGAGAQQDNQQRNRPMLQGVQAGFCWAGAGPKEGGPAGAGKVCITRCGNGI